MMECRKHLFDIPEDVTYLNTAYMAPLLKSSADTGCAAVRKKLRPYEILTEDFFRPVERIKEAFSRLVMISDPQRIAVIPSVSYGIANACSNIPFQKGDEILVVSDQFPSNVYPWMELAKAKNGKLVTIDAPRTNTSKADRWNELIMQAINKRTRIVALPHIHWSEGIIFDLKNIRQKVHQHNGYLIVDGTQSVGAYPFSIEDIRPDALIVAGYKWLMGPYALGLAYYNERFDDGIPIENNWINRMHSENFAGLVDYQNEYKPKAQRYSVGESSNFASIPVLQESLEMLLEWTPAGVQQYCGNIVNSVIPVINSYDYVVAEQGQRSNHLFGIMIPSDLSVDHLKSEFSKHRIFVSFRGNYIRVSPFVFNHDKDLHTLCETLINCRKAKG